MRPNKANIQKNITGNDKINRNYFIGYFYISVLHLLCPVIKRHLSQKVKKIFKSKKICNMKEKDSESNVILKIT